MITHLLSQIIPTFIMIIQKEVITKKKFNLKNFQMDTSINSSTIILKRSIIGLTKFKKNKLIRGLSF